jgi:hypothetical protein
MHPGKGFSDERGSTRKSGIEEKAMGNTRAYLAWNC